MRCESNADSLKTIKLFDFSLFKYVFSQIVYFKEKIKLKKIRFDESACFIFDNTTFNEEKLKDFL